MFCPAMDWKLEHLPDPLQSPCVPGKRPRVPRGWVRVSLGVLQGGSWEIFLLPALNTSWWNSFWCYDFMPLWQ